ncbi:hypothetical protein [Ileibacterium valens]|nr:hypothetical protein [Ileibacterium valens]
MQKARSIFENLTDEDTILFLEPYLDLAAFISIFVQTEPVLSASIISAASKYYFGPGNEVHSIKPIQL